MYSKDIFPKYSSGGLPIPENYSGSALRRTPPQDSYTRAAEGNGTAPTRAGGSGMSPARGGSPRVHTPASRASGRTDRARGRDYASTQVPLTVSSAFSAQQTPPDGTPSVQEEDPPWGESPTADRTEDQTIPHGNDPADRDHEGGDTSNTSAKREGDTPHDTNTAQAADFPSGTDDPPDPSPSPHRRGGISDDNGAHASAAFSGASIPERSILSSALSSFLPPKPDGLGALSQIGLEEALLLGLFLLLSQSDSEDDTLMLLALLFLYR